MVGRSRIVARRAIWQTNSEPMMDRADVAFRHLPVRALNGLLGAAAGPGRGTVDLAGVDDACVRTLKFVSFSRERSGELTERDVVPAASLAIG